MCGTKKLIFLTLTIILLLKSPEKTQTNKKKKKKKKKKKETWKMPFLFRTNSAELIYSCYNFPHAIC